MIWFWVLLAIGACVGSEYASLSWQQAEAEELTGWVDRLMIITFICVARLLMVGSVYAAATSARGYP